MSDSGSFTSEMAADPSLSQADMQQIAATRPDLLPALATNPALYPQLRQWLENHPNPAVREALSGTVENAHTVRADPKPARVDAPQSATPESSSRWTPEFVTPASYTPSRPEPASAAQPAPVDTSAFAPPQVAPTPETSPLTDLLNSAPRDTSSLNTPFSHIPSMVQQPPAKKSNGKTIAIALAIIVVLAVVVFGVAWLVLKDDGSGNAQGDSAQPQSVTGEVTSDPTEDLESEPATSETAGNVVMPAPAGALDISGFSSPTGNLQCQFTQTGAGQQMVKCTIWEYEFQPDVSCTESGAPITYELFAQGEVRKRCTYTDTVENMPVADYETSMAQNGFACTLEQYNGFTCWSEESGEGFQIRKRWDRVF